jgi:hypothetical protein
MLVHFETGYGALHPKLEDRRGLLIQRGGICTPNTPRIYYERCYRTVNGIVAPSKEINQQAWSTKHVDR